MSMKIYVEGGGESNRLRTECRKGFRSFFETSGLTGKMPAVVACGSRNDAYKSFCTALKRPKTGEVPLLLVDSEDAFSGTPWTHLQARDHWDQPRNATDEHVYLMVHCMESWFLADPECLKTYFGNGFNENSLPGNVNVETISKVEVFKALKTATRRSKSKGEYGKGQHSFEILERIDPGLVRAAAPNADRLLKKLESQ